MPRAGARSLPQLSVRIDLDSEDRIGPGKIQLLEKIRERGSISAAAMPRSSRRPAARTAAARC
jgi:molybdate transport system regulatory protein